MLLHSRAPKKLIFFFFLSFAIAGECASIDRSFDSDRHAHLEKLLDKHRIYDINLEKDSLSKIELVKRLKLNLDLLMWDIGRVVPEPYASFSYPVKERRLDNTQLKKELSNLVDLALNGNEKELEELASKAAKRAISKFKSDAIVDGMPNESLVLGLKLLNTSDFYNEIERSVRLEYLFAKEELYMAKVLKKLNSFHARVLLTQNETFIYPVNFIHRDGKYFAKDLRRNGSDDVTSKDLLSEVISINGVAIKNVIEEVSKLLPVEKTVLHPLPLYSYTYLEEAGIVKDAFGALNIGLRDEKNLIF